MWRQIAKHETQIRQQSESKTRAINVINCDYGTLGKGSSNVFRVVKLGVNKMKEKSITE